MKRNETVAPNPYGGDWLEVDDSYLPAKQLPLLRSMIGRCLINIQRPINVKPKREVDQRDFFRNSQALIIVELDGVPPVCFDYLKYHRHEISIDVSSGVPPLGGVEAGWFHLYTLSDREYVDDRLYHLIGRKIIKVRILIRKPDLLRDLGQALQDGIEITFDNDTTIVISYYLNDLQSSLFRILYPEEIPWHAVEYVVDVAEGRIPWRYRFKRWRWQTLDRLLRRINGE